MKTQSPHLLIFSVFQSRLSVYENLQEHHAVKNNLTENKIPHIEVKGKYKGGTELGLIVPASYKKIVNEFCSQYKQECFLEHHPDRHCDLVYLDGKRESLGTLIEVSKDRAEKMDAYTQTPDGRYFITE